MWSVINRRDTKKTVVNISVNDTNIQLLSNILINKHDLLIILVNKVNNDKQIARSFHMLNTTSRKQAKSSNLTFQTILN